jgi:hypothetical protein
MDSWCLLFTSNGLRLIDSNVPKQLNQDRLCSFLILLLGEFGSSKYVAFFFFFLSFFFFSTHYTIGSIADLIIL